MLDKATLDSLINAEGGEEQVLRMLQEADRVLSNGGRYVCISHSDRREMLLSRGFCSWELEAQDTLAKNKARFWMGVYVKRKQPNGNGSALRT